MNQVLIVDETIEDDRKMKQEGVIFKIGFEKAYNHGWDFLDKVVWKKGFGYNGELEFGVV